MRTLVWYRGKDLRVADHAPLRDAAASGEVIPLFVLEDRSFAGERARELPHRIQFLLDSPRSLPVTQGQKLDPEGDYVRRWVPELARLPARYIHAPWQAPDAVLRAAGVTLGKNYPHPIVDHAEARRRFLMLAEDFLPGRVHAAQ